MIVLAKEYDLNRIQVRELLKQYLGLELRSGEVFVGCVTVVMFVLRFVWMFCEIDGCRCFEFQVMKVNWVMLMTRTCFLLSIGLRETWDKLLSQRTMFFLNDLITILGDWSSCHFFERIFCLFLGKVMAFSAYLHGFSVLISMCSAWLESLETYIY